MIGYLFEYPAQIIAIIGRQAEFGTVSHDQRQNVEGLARDNAAFRMAPLWPRVGEQNEDPIDRSRRQGLDQHAGIVGEKSNVIEMQTLDLPQHLYDPVFEYLASDKTDFAMTSGLSGEMLTRAKTDLKPNRSSADAKPGARRHPTRRRDGQDDPGQQLAQQRLLAGPKRPPVSATEEQRSPRRFRDQRGSERAPQLIYQIELLPGETAVRFWRSAKMAIGGGAAIDRSIEAQVCADAAR
jgi:hypothetical protein